MVASFDDPAAEPAETELEAPLSALELRLAELATALQRSDAEAIDLAGAALRAALESAVAHFHHAAHQGSVPPALRRRLALASARVAVQREALARATASLDRAMDVLMPRGAPKMLYSSAGATERALPSGGLLA